MTAIDPYVEIPPVRAAPARRFGVSKVVARRLSFWSAVSALSIVVLLCVGAPLYAHYVAHTSVNEGNLNGYVTEHGRRIAVVSASAARITAGGLVHITAGGNPIGPQGFAAGGRYLLGADEEGRDVAVRLLYGGRLSLFIGLVAATLCILAAAVLALVSGYVGGFVDAVIGRMLDVIWSFPWILLSLAVGTNIAVGGFHHFGLNIGSGSVIVLIGLLTYNPVPYYARALRARVLTLRKSEFVESARLSGASTARVVLGQLLPNIATLLPAMFALDFANVLLGESTLTYLGVGVQPPTASWGSMIAEGQTQISTAPWLSLAPAIMVLVAALSLHVIGERLPGLDRSTVRGAS